MAQGKRNSGRVGFRQYAGLCAIKNGARSAGDILSQLEKEYGARQEAWFSNLGKKRVAPLSPEQVAWRYTVRLVYDLEKQGFIIRKPGALFLTDKGREKLRSLRDRIAKTIFKKEYPTQSSSELVILSFDIPEKQRHYREWLRAVLVRMGLKKYHQSLWMGNVQLSEDFLNDIALHGLQKYIAIFTVGKKGTLREML